MKPAARRGGVVVPQQPKWRGKAAGWALAAVLKPWAATWRVKLYPSVPAAFPDPIIFAVWHNRLAAVCGYWTRMRRQQKDFRLGAMVSASRDGGLLAFVLERFGIEPVRGSSSRRGAQALREAATLVESGSSVAITPDGPRGPKYSVQSGIIGLAQITGRPIRAIGVRISRKKQLSSWDAFQVPLPFAQCEFSLSEPMLVEREATSEQREAKRAELERILIAMNPD